MKNTLTVDGTTFLRLPIIDTSLNLYVYDITPDIFSQIKTKLYSLYGRELIADGATEISVPPEREFNKERYNAADALRVTARLTRDGDGCPWDRAQTHESIRINMIEEAYEAVDAIDKRDIPNMREEFGDVFLQSLLQSDIARRAGEFDFNDVCDELCKKLIGRHTFIFGDDSAGSPDEALTLWEKAKGIEKNYDTVKTQLSKLPDNFPALLYAQKTYKKLKKAGHKSDPKSELDNAVANGDYTAAIDACVALLADSGMDVEVELNKRVKAKISEI
ncbi:MAG: nucleoside triphosphate pyrophosphohydrolase [Clostridiales bacterium]|nr:nucleoside triphosphate pyrophosphohydrolase [Clostridiales bacterium]